MSALHFSNRKFAVSIGIMLGLIPAICGCLRAQEHPMQKDMKFDQGKLIWTAPKNDAEKNNIVYFVYDKNGLTDIDGHQITDKGWKNMRSPGIKFAAHLRIDPSITMEEVRRALGILSSKGKYQTVEITTGSL